MTSSHSFVVILSEQISCLISSSNISAAVPGRVLKPRAFNSCKYSASSLFKVLAPCQISKGEKACICNSGCASLIEEIIDL